MNSQSVPESVHADMFRATLSFSTSEGGKRYRLRFLPIGVLEETDQKTIDDVLSAFPFVFKYAMRLQLAKVAKRRSNFAEMIETRSKEYDR